MSVDTFLKGKRTNGYRRYHEEDLTVMVSPKLIQFASKVELVSKKKLIGTNKVVVIAHHEHTARCRH